MMISHAKATRRRILVFLYERYHANPLEMVLPESFFDDGFTRDELIFNIHYLHDAGLVELLMGYQPPLFSGARITAKGMDICEDAFELDRRFPEAPEPGHESFAALPRLLEELAAEAELVPLDGEQRRALFRDVNYLREEIARPVARWRRDVMESILTAMAAPFDDVDGHLPAYSPIRRIISS